jgi:hypothetical protein
MKREKIGHGELEDFHVCEDVEEQSEDDRYKPRERCGGLGTRMGLTTHVEGVETVIAIISFPLDFGGTVRYC